MVEAQGQQKTCMAQFENVLPNAVKGQVVTRFPPEPSGYLHIGHVKAAMLNYHYSKIYEGKMILRFDDTNPVKENLDFVTNISEDLKRLEIYPDVISYTSDFFGLLEEKCRELIKAGKGYCDNTEVNKMRQERSEGIESACRSQTVEQNLEIFEKMVKGENKDYCVRGKIDMQCKNKCMRDPVFYRSTTELHHRTGDQFKIFPTYDFACPIVDSTQGVTHCLRTNEYADRNAMYEWVIEACNMKPVQIYDFSRLNLVNTVLSKRKLQMLVDTGIVDGWNDPRFPTVQGILRRGITVECLKQFMLEQGPSKNTNLQEWDKLWAKNKQIIDPIASRLTAISSENLCLVTLTNMNDEIKTEQVDLHPKNSSLGQKPLYFYKDVLCEVDDLNQCVVGEKITLMKWGNATIQEIVEGGGSIHNLPYKLHVKVTIDLNDKDFKKTKKITWLAAVPQNVQVTIVEFDHIINKKKIEENDVLENLLNKQSKACTNFVCDPYISTLNQGSIIQIERRGFFYIDKPGILHFVPDGKSKSMSTLSGKVDVKQVAKGTQDQQPSAKQLQKKSKKEKKKKEESEKQGGES